MPVEVRNLQRRRPVSARRIRGTAGRTLALLGRPDREVHVTLVDDPAIRRLNARYKAAAAPTDVLAFQLDAPGPSPLLGEIVISADTAARQARALGVPLALELDLLVVHGLLHLIGYDDHDAQEARLMHERAREILAAPSRSGGRAIPRRLWRGLLEDGRG
jgi:probable rRNA maturation factor